MPWTTEEDGPVVGGVVGVVLSELLQPESNMVEAKMVRGIVFIISLAFLHWTTNVIERRFILFDSEWYWTVQYNLLQDG